MTSWFNGLCLLTCWLPNIYVPSGQSVPGSEPDITGKTFLHTGLMYNITSAPNVNIGGQIKSVWVGNVVGGGSVVNGMAFDRASAADYDAWEQLGNNGWVWNNLLPYFKKSTTFTPPSAENVKAWGTTYDVSYYGATGPIQASFPEFEYPAITTIWATYKAQGVLLPEEHALGNSVGAYWTPTALRPKAQTRSDAKNCYHDPVESRSNLVLATGKTVNEILFDQGLLTGYKAKGVRYVSRKDNSVQQVYASKEVIVAAGSVFTPHLLQLSGIGPKDVLNAAGVRNMATPNPLSGLDPAFNASAWAQYNANRTGPITQAHGSSLGFLSLQTISDNYQSIISTIKNQNARTYLPSVYADSKLLAGFNKQRDTIADLHSRTDAAVAEFPTVAFGVAISSLQRLLSRGTVTSTH
ncbi:GMC oxidoreductase [Karstenula rhodostoma CBS 690.94]|uniref:GMC oxidoreductase n=1 Tax=Karstenula rhodostoma CBS 690.94 TaxID=1392251 RepID=A0A9P4PSC1_9PLEO|nr:GMC oxidoreductase [Karstenula rhodostoma CBS 690.94]